MNAGDLRSDADSDPLVLCVALCPYLRGCTGKRDCARGVSAGPSLCSSGQPIVSIQSKVLNV